MATGDGATGYDDDDNGATGDDNNDDIDGDGATGDEGDNDSDEDNYGDGRRRRQLWQWRNGQRRNGIRRQ